MTMRPATSRRAAFLTLPLIAVLAIGTAACSDDSRVSPTAPTAPAAPAKLLGLDPLFSATTNPLTGTLSATTGLVSTTLYSVTGLLTCPAQNVLTTSKIIGPLGGRIVIGDHELVVPAGALSEYVKISATRKSGTLAEVDFQPHGLQFDKPAALRMSYDRCSTPAKSVQSIVYVNDEHEIIEMPRSADDQRVDEVTAWINHFSGYVIATTRASSAE